MKQVNSTTITIIISVIIILIVVGIIVFIPKKAETVASEALNTFAKCITDSGAKFYGAFWCPHCASQKALFGSATKYLPYIECSTPDQQGQTQICIDKNIAQYPTWVFKDGTTHTGELSLAELSAQTQCPLPDSGQVATSTVPTTSTSSAAVQ